MACMGHTKLNNILNKLLYVVSFLGEASEGRKRLVREKRELESQLKARVRTASLLVEFRPDAML